MSVLIKHALSTLNVALDRLEGAVDTSIQTHHSQRRELFKATSAHNDNGAAGGAMNGINGENVELFTARLDNAIEKVEGLLREDATNVREGATNG